MNFASEHNTTESPSQNTDYDFKGIVDISPYPIFIHNAGVVKYANVLAKKLVNLREDEDVTGVSLLKYLHPDDISVLNEAIVKSQTNHISEIMNFRVIDPDGNTRLFQCRSSSISFAGESCRLVHIYNFDKIKQAQEETLQKQQLLDKLIEFMPDSLVVVNSVTRKQLYNNKSFAKYLGYGPEDFENELHKDEFDLIAKKIHPSDIQKLTQARDFINNPANIGKLYTTEYRIMNKAGQWRWILGRSCNLMPSADGVGSINFGIVQDITEIRENQEELINYRMFQEKVNSTSPVLVSIFSPDQMTSIYRSKDMAEWFNYAPEDFPERTLDLVHPDYRQEAIDSIAQVSGFKDGEMLTTVFPFLTGNGGIKFILTRSTVFQRDETGKTTHILFTHSDITDFKEVEYKLDKSEETRKAILYAIPDMVAIVNADSIVSDFYPNESMRKQTENRDLRDLHISKIIGKESSTEVTDLITKTIEENKLQSCDFKLVGADKTYHYELRISPFNSEEVIIVARDISDQKVIQDQINHYHEELYTKNQELERYITSNSELEKFAYIASHDLREPLRSLIGFAQLLQKRNQGKLSHESEDFIDNIIQGAQRMNTLVSGLLEYSRITSAGKPFTTVNLADLIKKVQSDLKISIEENHAQFVIFELPEVYGDELQIRQLLQNLISNAIKFRSDKHPIIKISSEKTDRHWLFKIEDNGIGIDMKFKDQVFQIFTRLHSQDKYQGSGIGLSVCKKILERHGGQIWLESTPGKGTTMFFTILTA